jgi:adenylate kinase
MQDNFFVILGPPLSGKGTQGKVIARKSGLYYLSTCRIFREEMRRNSKIGKKIRDIINMGLLVDDSIVNKIVSNRICECDNGFILDGYPRTLNQAVYLDKILQNGSVKINLVLVLNIGKKESFTRALGRERVDDKSKEVLERRWDEYCQKTVPVIRYFEKRGIIVEVDGTGTISDVENRIATELNI